MNPQLRLTNFCEVMKIGKDINWTQNKLKLLISMEWNKLFSKHCQKFSYVQLRTFEGNDWNKSLIGFHNTIFSTTTWQNIVSALGKWERFKSSL